MFCAFFKHFEIPSIHQLLSHTIMKSTHNCKCKYFHLFLCLQSTRGLQLIHYFRSTYEECDLSFRIYYQDYHYLSDRYMRRRVSKWPSIYFYRQHLLKFRAKKLIPRRSAFLSRVVKYSIFISFNVFNVKQRSVQSFWICKISIARYY